MEHQCFHCILTGKLTISMALFNSKPSLPGQVFINHPHQGLPSPAPRIGGLSHGNPSPPSQFDPPGLDGRKTARKLSGKSGFLGFGLGFANEKMVVTFPQSEPRIEAHEISQSVLGQPTGVHHYHRDNHQHH